MGEQQHQREPWAIVLKGEFIVSAENRIVCQFFNKRDKNFSDYNANAERIVACVNACAGIDSPEHFIAGMRMELKEIREAVKADEQEATSDEVRRVVYERDQLLQQLKKLLHMHSCEQEAIIMPTAAQWFQAVNEAEEVAFKIDPSPYNPNE